MKNKMKIIISLIVLSIIIILVMVGILIYDNNNKKENVNKTSISKPKENNKIVIEKPEVEEKEEETEKEEPKEEIKEVAVEDVVVKKTKNSKYNGYKYFEGYSGSDDNTTDYYFSKNLLDKGMKLFDSNYLKKFNLENCYLSYYFYDNAKAYFRAFEDSKEEDGEDILKTYGYLDLTGEEPTINLINIDSNYDLNEVFVVHNDSLYWMSYNNEKETSVLVKYNINTKKLTEIVSDKDLDSFTLDKDKNIIYYTLYKYDENDEWYYEMYTINTNVTNKKKYSKISNQNIDFVYKDLVFNFDYSNNKIDYTDLNEKADFGILVDANHEYLMATGLSFASYIEDNKLMFRLTDTDYPEIFSYDTKTIEWDKEDYYVLGLK